MGDDRNGQQRSDATEVMELRRLPSAFGRSWEPSGVRRVVASAVLAALAAGAIGAAYLARETDPDATAAVLDTTDSTEPVATTEANDGNQVITALSTARTSTPVVSSTTTSLTTTTSTASTSSLTGPTTSSTSPPPVWRVIQQLDFGPAGAPVASGYTRVSPNEPGPLTLAGGGIQATDRGLPDDVRRDLVFANGPRVFSLPVEPGLYRVTLTLGDLTNPHDEMVVSVESSTIATGVTTAAGDFTTVTGEVEVSDGELSIGLNVAGGADPNWVLNAMVIEFDTQP
ncbi:MAG: hypothetical protein AAF467_26295 [Actinomycetota bacterium]